MVHIMFVQLFRSLLHLLQNWWWRRNWTLHRREGYGILIIHLIKSQRSLTPLFGETKLRWIVKICFLPDAGWTMTGCQIAGWVPYFATLMNSKRFHRKVHSLLIITCFPSKSPSYIFEFISGLSFIIFSYWRRILDEKGGILVLIEQKLFDSCFCCCFSLKIF